MTSSEHTISMADGTELFAVIDTPEIKSKGIVIVTHGTCEYHGRYEFVAQELVKHGFTSFRWDMRGHGKSGGKRVYFESGQEAVDDLATIVAWVKSKYPDEPLFMISHSAGSVIVASFAAAYPGHVMAYAISGLSYRGELIDLQIPHADKPNNFYVPSPLDGGACRIDNAPYAYCHDPLIERKISLGFLRSVDGLKSKLNSPTVNIEDPCAFFHGALDPICDPMDPMLAYTMVGTPKSELHIYANIGHDILRSDQKERVMDDMIQWFEYNKDRVEKD